MLVLTQYPTLTVVSASALDQLHPLNHQIADFLRRLLALDRALTTFEARQAPPSARYWARFTKELLEQFVPPFTKAVRP